MNYRLLYLLSILFILFSCSEKEIDKPDGLRYNFPQILDVSYTPNSLTRNYGWFTDAGSWMGFTIPEKDNWVNGFCGPFSLDMNRREWLSKSAVTVYYLDSDSDIFTKCESNYFPGEIFISAENQNGKISQTLNFIDESNALLIIESEGNQPLKIRSKGWTHNVDLNINNNYVTASHPIGEIVQIAFPYGVELSLHDGEYEAVIQPEGNKTPIVISFVTSDKELTNISHSITSILNSFASKRLENTKRWDGYISKILRNDMGDDYDRIAVKAVTTLISNWRVHKGGLLHDGIVPSHGVNYFVGFWAWDTWRFAAATAKFYPELAKNNIRAMFDYQQEDGMIIDCIYTDPSENNARDSKPPLVSWAVDEVFKHTNDTAFVREMYPQLVSYYKWWFDKRDIDNNGICEYGSTDGTLEAAAWESGMDNAIRFDGTKMLKNQIYDDAWSMNQESVDLNSYLVLEHNLLKKFSKLLNQEFDFPSMKEIVSEYFFDSENGFFFDKRIEDKTFIKEYGCEAYTPLWTQVASKEQVEQMLPILKDTTRFSTYIPFPTVSADNEKYNSRGYWRGPIWLDQTYFAIKGLRNYGYSDLADEYTAQVFDRLEGLKNGAAIHENYGTHTGEKLKAPHFSWSAAHLLMMYEDFGK